MSCSNLFRCLILITLLPAALHSVEAQNHWQPPGGYAAGGQPLGGYAQGGYAPGGYAQGGFTQGRFAPNYAPSGYAQGGQSQASVIDHYVGEKPRLFDSEQPFERALAEVTKRSWIRLEFLHWNLDGPDSRAIGAPLLNPTNPLIVPDNQNGGLPTGVGITPNASGLGLNSTSGIRGTWGLDLSFADFELEFFGTEDKNDTFGFNNLAGFRTAGAEAIGTVGLPNVVIPLLTNGGVADAATANFLIFDESFNAELESQLWGSEATFFTKPYLPGNGFQWQWLAGFRYLAYDETFRSTGVFNNGGTQLDQVTQISADSTNDLYGPQVGFRTQVDSKWFTFSATPRVAFTLNNNTGSAFFNGVETGDDDDVDFTPIVQVSFKGEVHVTPNFSFYGGYDFMWIYRLSRPSDNLVFDSTPGVGGDFTTEIRQQTDLQSFAAEGLTVGAVLRY